MTVRLLWTIPMLISQPAAPPASRSFGSTNAAPHTQTHLSSVTYTADARHKAGDDEQIETQLHRTVVVCSLN